MSLILGADTETPWAICVFVSVNSGTKEKSSFPGAPLSLQWNHWEISTDPISASLDEVKLTNIPETTTALFVWAGLLFWLPRLQWYSELILAALSQRSTIQTCLQHEERAPRWESLGKSTLDSSTQWKWETPTWSDQIIFHLWTRILFCLLDRSFCAKFVFIFLSHALLGRCILTKKKNKKRSAHSCQRPTQSHVRRHPRNMQSLAVIKRVDWWIFVSDTLSKQRESTLHDELQFLLLFPKCQLFFDHPPYAEEWPWFAQIESCERN